MKYIFKFLAFVILLNIIRYLIAGPLEMVLVLDRLFGAMEKSASYFHTQFTTFDWVTSYFYNFMMWLITTWVFIQMQSTFRGNYLSKSLKAYGLMYLFFASVSAIYMNHYSHPKDFYLYNIADSAIPFTIVAIATAFLYPLIFKKEINQASTVPLSPKEE
jgi:hypothetical protein